LYKQKDILGQNKKILAKPKLGNKEVMADYIEDLQIVKESKNESNINSDITAPIKWIAPKIVNSDGNNPYPGNSNTGSANFISDGENVLNCWHGGSKEERACSGTGTSWTKKGAGLLEFDLGSMCNIYSFRAYFGNINNNIRFSASSDGKRLYPRGEKSDCWAKTKGLSYCYGGWRVFNKVGGHAHDNITDSNKRNGPLQAKIIKVKVYPSSSGWSELSKFTVAARCSEVKNTPTGLYKISLTLRTKNKYGKDRQFKKKDYHAGNYKLDKTDKYKRDTFSSTVLVRNLAL
jgi:hypothetical protein